MVWDKLLPLMILLNQKENTMKTLINVVTALLVLSILIVAFALTVTDLSLIIITALIIAIVMMRLSNIPTTLIEGPISVEFMAHSDDTGFELFLEYIEEEDFDISGDFEDGLIICWISNPNGEALSECQLQGLLDMQNFLNNWA